MYNGQFIIGFAELKVDNYKIIKFSNLNQFQRTVVAHRDATNLHPFPKIELFF